MLAAYHRYQAVLSSPPTYIVDDVLRFEKVEALRQGTTKLFYDNNFRKEASQWHI